VLEAHCAGHRNRAAPVLHCFRRKLFDVNGVAGKRDVGGDVIVAGSQIGEPREAVAERDLPEQLWLLGAPANVDVGHDGATRVNQARHECADESQIDAVSSHVTFDRVAAQPDVLDDELRLAAMLQEKRIEREKPLRELKSRGVLESVTIRGIHQHRGRVESHDSRVASAGEIPGELRLHAALAQHRSAEMSRRRRH